jgi:hypothetical protein
MNRPYFILILRNNGAARRKENMPELALRMQLLEISRPEMHQVHGNRAMIR